MFQEWFYANGGFARLQKIEIYNPFNSAKNLLCAIRITPYIQIVTIVRHLCGFQSVIERPSIPEGFREGPMTT
jgi:hypothetical protein